MLAVLHPLLVRLGLRSRWVVAVAALGLFTVVTRWEPSVLRAVVMATVALSAWTMGRHVRAGRVVALAVTAVVALDPLIVHSLGFRLSVAATVGLVTMARPLARRLPGPPSVASALAVVLAAQVGATPLLVAAGATWSPTSILANLLAGPVAGAVMMWGLTAGMVAGLVGGAIATALHLPTRVMLAWIDGVAAAAAHPRWPEWPPVVIVVAAALSVGAWGLWRRGHRLLGGLGVVAVLVGGSLAATSGPYRFSGSEELGSGATISEDARGLRLEVSGRASLSAVLAGVTRRGCPDVVSVAPGDRAAAIARAVAELCGAAPVVVDDAG